MDKAAFLSQADGLFIELLRFDHMAFDPGSAAEVRSAHLVAELLDEIHQRPEKFANGCRTSEFIQHAANTLFDGNLSRLAKYLGNVSVIENCCRDRHRKISLPMLTTIADRCDCKISDVVLGNDLKLHKMYADAKATSVTLARQRGVRTFKTSDALLTELDKLDKLGILHNLSQASRLLDVNINCLQTLTPDFAAMLVHRGQESRRMEKLTCKERAFDEYWRHFQELRQEGVTSTRKKLRSGYCRVPE
ncbi:hypothetical protein AB4Y32_09505 [Paraburkholderia phymatum]|uniref:Uncharacterized protein n=1 Tax=Paraburkholderia phymatum TaxID=148447 RepID=A0ACC6TXK2_9BURK